MATPGVTSALTRALGPIDKLMSMVNRRKGFARPNRFEVDFSGLIKLNLSETKGNDTLADMGTLVDSISIPGRSFSTFEYSIWNHPIKVPSGYDEDDIEIVFNITNDFMPKMIMDAWFAKVINQWSYLVSYDSDYKCDITIKQLNENDDVIFTAKLINAYPISVKGVFLDNNSESSISRFSSTIAFDRFISDNKNIAGMPISSFVKM